MVRIAGEFRLAYTAPRLHDFPDVQNEGFQILPADMIVIGLHGPSDDLILLKIPAKEKQDLVEQAQILPDEPPGKGMMNHRVSHF